MKIRTSQYLLVLACKQGVRITLATLALSVSSVACAAGYQIGVYYFPGWENNQPGMPAPLPWQTIKAFPERQPLLGWYDDSSDAVVQKQIDWMANAGLSYVVFDLLFQGNRAYLDQSLNAYLRAPNRNKLKFSILWANHNKTPNSLQQWQDMVHYWVNNYFSRPELLRINGQPVIFVFSAWWLDNQAQSFGMTTKDLIASAQHIMHDAGLPDIYFVAGTGADVPMINSAGRDAGYSAFTTYNYQRGPLPPHNTYSHSYAELDEDYREQWYRFASDGNLPLIVPMTSGWDRRPWGGSKDPQHDNSLSTPALFKEHLKAAKSFMDAHQALTHNRGVICCWNEFGEGSFIEPTKAMGFAFLDQIANIFGQPGN